MVWLIKSKMLTKNCHSQTEPSIVQQLQILKYLIEIWPKSQETLWPPAQNIQNIPANIWPPAQIIQNIPTNIWPLQSPSPAITNLGNNGAR